MAKGELIFWIIAFCVFLAILFLVCFNSYINKPFGEFQKNSLQNNTFSPDACDYSRFNLEYGPANKYGQFEFSGNKYNLLYFDNNWITVVEPSYDGLCYLVEDNLESYGAIRAAYFISSLQNISPDFYEPFLNCTKDSKGAQALCNITENISKTLDSLVIKIILNVPDVAFDSVIKNLESDGWKKVATISANSIRFSKYFIGSSVFEVSLEVTKAGSCYLADAKETKVFDLANEIRQYYKDAKNNIIHKNTIDLINSTNSVIDSMYGIKYKDSDFIKGFIDYVSNIQTNETNCNTFKPREQIQYFSSKVSGIDSNAQKVYTNYVGKLNYLRANAFNQIELESKVKQEFSPDLSTWFYLTGKSIEYSFMSSEARAYANSQLYVSSEKISKDYLKNYSSFWDTILPVDYLFSVSYLLLVTLVSFLFLWVYKNKLFFK